MATFDGEQVKRFFEKGSRQHEIFGQGDPSAVVMELTDGDILTVFEDAPQYDEAVALEDEYLANQPERE